MSKQTWCPRCKRYSVGVFSRVCQLCGAFISQYGPVDK